MLHGVKAKFDYLIQSLCFVHILFQFQHKAQNTQNERNATPLLLVQNQDILSPSIK